MYKIDQDTPPPPTALASEIAQRTATKADQAVAATQSAVNQTADDVNEGLDNLGESGTSALTRGRSSDPPGGSARRAGSAVLEQAQVTGDRTVEYIRQEPVKAVLMAAAAGAVVALLLGRRGH